jgi:membrane fusion protein, multidrug efflux system
MAGIGSNRGIISRVIGERMFSQPKSAPFPAVALALAAAIAILLGGCQRGGGADAEAKTADGKPVEEVKIPVEMALVKRESISSNFQGTAALEAQAVAQVVAKTGGVILAIRVEEGQFVARGALLAQLENDRQRLSLAQASANLRKVQNDLKRQTELFNRKLIGSGVFEQLKLDLETLKASYDIAALELSYTEIRAPISGTVSQRMVKLGNQINVGQSLFRIDDFDPLEARVAVPERDMQAIKAGQAVQMLVDAMPGQVFVGSVGRVSPVVDPKTGTFDVIAQFKDANQTLRSGMFGRINIVTSVHENALIVPRVALLTEDGSAAVYVVVAGKVVRKAVTLGFTSDGRSEILSGLAVGDQVVTLGQNAVREGSLVQVINAPKTATPAVVKPAVVAEAPAPAPAPAP